VPLTRVSFLADLALSMEAPLTESHSAEAINAQVVAAEAVEKARVAQMQEMLEASEERMTEAFSTALRDVFDEKRSSGQFIDVSRIPLLCQSIIDIRGSMKDIKDGMVTKQEFVPVRYLVYGACLLILIGFFGSLIIHAIPGAQINVP
jgi:hypothetical protein